MKDDEIRKAVRERYGQRARQVTSCCSTTNVKLPGHAERLYSNEELSDLPQSVTNAVGGCGNPTALASLKKGEVVLDLGAGGGIDCFLAANRVGETGKVIGVDMTPEMLQLARDNTDKMQVTNVEFRLGEIENLPVADNSVDVVISNCVINLSPDKARVFTEVFRVLKPGGRLMISDMVLLKELPDAIKSSVAAYTGCIAGASRKEEYLATITAAGFQEVSIIDETPFPIEGIVNDPTAKAIIENLEIPPEKIKEVANSVISIKVSGVKPI